MFTLSPRPIRIGSFRDVILLLLLLAGLPRFTAALDAMLLGIVTAQSEGVMSNVTITITDIGTGVASDFRTKDAGQQTATVEASPITVQADTNETSTMIGRDTTHAA